MRGSVGILDSGISGSGNEYQVEEIKERTSEMRGMGIMVILILMT